MIHILISKGILVRISIIVCARISGSFAWIVLFLTNILDGVAVITTET